MTEPLAPELRKQLGKAVRKARSKGEAGAFAALRALAVHAPRPHESMSADEKALRRRLQAHGEQLGDQRDGQRGTQEVARLAHEIAYEHWHRMLFARFLAENRLLVEPASGVPVSLEECAELAREGLGADGWEVAERFASRMLPSIFRPEDPALAVNLAPETRQALEKLVGELPATVFTASDSLGWTYQFWQADRKEDVNQSGAKIGADDLPAVTQLFTENYMVRFLFHNTIGSWRAGKVLAERPELARSASSEAELTAAVRIEPQRGLDGYDFDCLRFTREPGRDAGEDGAAETAGPWRPAAGAFRGWPSRAADLHVLDPCCGSGHFLVEGLELLVRLRMEEEDLGLEEAVSAVLRDNLFGLEIDARCTQIAAFNLTLAAWRMVGRPVGLPTLQVACTGLAVASARENWLSMAAGERTLEHALDRLYELFREAPTLGSLVDAVAVGEGLFQEEYDTAERLLDRAAEDRDVDIREKALTAQRMFGAADLLRRKYHLVVTNVPYLARGRQSARLQKLAADGYPDAKADLATVFVSRILGWLADGGAQAVVVPRNWLFLKTYGRLRERLLREETWRLDARLGPGAFETISGHVVNVAMTVLSAGVPHEAWRMAGLDVSSREGERMTSPREKAELLRHAPVHLSLQRDQLRNPDACVLLRPLRGVTLLMEYSYGHQGIATADYACFGRKFWELPDRGSSWEFQQSTVRETRQMGGREHVLHWEAGEGPLQRSESVRIQGGGSVG